MLYVFHVDTGTMMRFDMSLALESVAQLKKFVEQDCRIPADKQVLLVSGGESLEEKSRVCSYAAGTDTNPIFLFSKSVIESTTPPCASVNYGSDYDFKVKVKEAQDLPASYDTVVHRAHLAQLFHDCAKQQTDVCERLVHDQHLQQQGWAAVIANLEDLSVEFKRRADLYEKGFNEYLNEHQNYLKFLQHFHEDLQILAKIPIIPTLLEAEKNEIPPIEKADESNETVKDEEEETQPDSGAESVKPITLLEWISATDSKSTMEQLFEHCSRGLEQFDEKIFKALHLEVETAIEASDKSNMKEVKGLGDRLFGLDQLMLEAKRYVREQADLAQSFLANQNRAGNLGDASILPDLCDSHRKQLLVLQHNHEQLCDIRRRCMRAKEELSVNLYHRLRWVMYVENLMVDASHRLVIYHDNLKRLRQHLEVLQQIHLAPTTYLSAVAEVVRRRAFSQAFLLWASELACHLLTIYNEEVTRRKEFQSGFEGHFLNALFPGMDDLPPNFATQAPSIFDSSLPAISNEDIDYLKEMLPDLTDNLSVPDMSAITNFFLAKSDISKTADDRGVEEKLVQVVSEVGLASNMDENLLKPAESDTCLATTHGLAHLKDLDKGCESETDTEEFEKVCQSPLDLQFDKELASPRPRSNDASTSTEVCVLTAPKKPPRAFQKLTIDSVQPQRALSISGSNTDSFTNIKNPSLESIDELSSLKNAESCYNSHHQQQQLHAGHLLRSKSLSPHTAHSPKGEHALSPVSPSPGHQPSDFVSEEFYIDESLPSSLSIETGNATHGEYAKQLSNANDVVALLQDNLQTSRSETDKLKSIIAKLATMSRQAIVQLKRELSDLKSLYESEKSNMEMHYSGLSNSWENLAVEMDVKEKEIIQRISIDHEFEMSDYRRIVSANKDQIVGLQEENIRLRHDVKDFYDEYDRLQADFERSRGEFGSEVAELKQKVLDLEADKEKSVKETSERLIREHKAQIESIKKRFRLMTTSPSDPNLEKIERRDVYEAEKQRAMEELKRLEAERWERILANKMEMMKNKFDSEKAALIEDVSRRVTEDKDKQIHMLMEREHSLSLECIKYKDTIHQLAECEVESRGVNLAERVAVLEREKVQLEMELSVERNRRLHVSDMTASVSVYEGARVDVATSPVRHREMTRSQASLIRSAKLSIESCNPGDAVLIIWDVCHDNFTILQETSHLYFLHTDCLEVLGLKKPVGDDKKLVYYTGEVIDKEYCHARKGENRYKVPKGTKFYRVRVKALSQQKDMNKSHLSDMTQSQTVRTAPPEHSVADSACYSLPSTPTKDTTESNESNSENR